MNAIPAQDKPARFSRSLLISAGLAVLLAVAFALYVSSRERVADAYELRHRSFLLADELRQSGDDLTRMVRTYVATGDPVFKQHFQDILDIRDGKKPRPENYWRPYWDLMPSGDPAPRPDSAQAVPLLELMRQAGFTDEEFRKLAEAKANSDALTALEIEAMKVVDSGGVVAEADRARALGMLFDEKYRQAKRSVMQPIHDFLVLVDQRTLASVEAAKTRATVLRDVFVAIAIGLMCMLWRTHSALRSTLGGPLEEVHAQIARIGSGDFSAAIPLRAGLENSVLGWLAETQAKLNAMERDRQQSEAAHRHLAAIVESTDDGVLSKTLTGIITSWNPGAERLFGYTAQEIIGRPMLTLIPPERAAEETHILERIARGEKVDNFETVRQRKDGRHVDVSVTISPVRDDSGRITGASKIVHEITARKRAEEELQRAKNTLEQRVKERTTELAAANRELEAFSYSVSHDLRAPLRAIDGFARILSAEHRSGLQPEAVDCLDEIIGGARQMGALIDDLLAFSRVGKQALQPRGVDLAAMVRECLKTLASEQNGRNVEIVIGELGSCEADPALLRQVWMNLLGNALKYTRKRADARIELGCREEDGARAYSIRDNGVGFDMKYAGKLFGVFQRLHRAEDFEGTGIGLATVQRIIHRHGGRVWAQGARNEGATFFFTVGSATPGHNHSARDGFEPAAMAPTGETL